MVLAIRNKILKIGGKRFKFSKIKINEYGELKSNVFRDYSSKTVSQILQKKRYRTLASEAKKRIGFDPDLPIGAFLFKLKEQNDQFYKKFLNPHGFKDFCKFKLANSEISSHKGIYAYYLNGTLMYIGQTKRSFKARVNSGYGNIFPRNCYKGGQSTNCKINALVSNFSKNGELAFFVCSLESNADIDTYEKTLIEKYSPEWNIQNKP